jgi:hypothetical protein
MIGSCGRNVTPISSQRVFASVRSGEVQLPMVPPPLLKYKATWPSTALAAKADATANAARAVTLYKRAAAARQAMYVFIPFAYRDLDYVVRPGIKGVHIRTGYFTVSFKRVSVG